MDTARPLALGSLCFLAVGCATGAPVLPGGEALVEVRVLSSTGLTLPAGDEVELTLADITRPELPPVVVARMTYPHAPSQVLLQLPLDLSLRYEAERIEPQGTYVVSVRVKDAEGKLRFFNLQSVYVLTKGALSRVDVTVDPVQRP
jgi:uncharacterized lipoprotein YbaY